MTEINLCSPTHEAQSEEINLCSSEQEEQDREINLCPGDVPPPDPCIDVPELFLTGPDEPEVNDQYTASGGLSPYSYSFTGGSIDSTGKITAVTSCGGPSGNGAIASVSVTDGCGQVASIEVRLPGGSWQGFSSWTQPSACTGVRVTWEDCVTSGDPSASIDVITEISGGMLYRSTYSCAIRYESSCSTPPIYAPPPRCGAVGQRCTTGVDTRYKINLTAVEHQQWVCP